MLDSRLEEFIVIVQDFQCCNFKVFLKKISKNTIKIVDFFRNKICFANLKITAKIFFLFNNGLSVKILRRLVKNEEDRFLMLVFFVFLVCVFH